MKIRGIEKDMDERIDKQRQEEKRMKKKREDKKKVHEWI